MGHFQLYILIFLHEMYQNHFRFAAFNYFQINEKNIPFALWTEGTTQIFIVLYWSFTSNFIRIVYASKDVSSDSEGVN